MYVADSQSNSKQNAGFTRGIRVVSARMGKVTALIPFVEPDPEKNNNAGVEGSPPTRRQPLRRGSQPPTSSRRTLRQ